MAKRGTCRIIAGNWRGRTISFNDADGLRPTTDRIRETVFNWLQSDLPASHCLDCFAGSGALGFEAASRGAASVLMLENNRLTAANLQTNVQSLEAESVSVKQVDCLQWLKQPWSGSEKQAFNLVFLDPPYQSDFLQQACFLLDNAGILQAGAKIYLEHALNDSIDTPPDWQCLKSKAAGQVAYKLFLKP